MEVYQISIKLSGLGNWIWDANSTGPVKSAKKISPFSGPVILSKFRELKKPIGFLMISGRNRS